MADAAPAPATVGAPPLAGFVGPGGQVVIWRDRQPMVLARWARSPVQRAAATPHGIVLFATDVTVLVRPDGRIEPLAEHTGPVGDGAVDPAGRLLAVAETHSGRRAGSRLHLIDLADKSRQSMPWPEQGVFLSVAAVHDGVVYARETLSGGSGLRWSPGSTPQRLPALPREVDPYSGVVLGYDGRVGAVLIGADGTLRPLAVDPFAMLAPGGTQVYTFRAEPPAMTIFDLPADGGPASVGKPHIHWLPPGSRSNPRRTDRGPLAGPVWEDRYHIVIPVEHPFPDVATAVRLDVRTGALQAVPLTDDTGNRPVLVEPRPHTRAPADAAAPDTAGGQRPPTVL